MDQQKTPPARRAIIQTRDLDVARVSFQALFGQFRADINGPFEWRVQATGLDPVLVVHDHCDAPTRIAGIPSMHVLTLLRAGAARASAPGARTDVRPGRVAAMFSPGDGVRWTAEGAVETISFRLDPRFLAAQLEALSGETAVRPIRFALELPTAAGAGAYVERLCQFIAGEIELGTSLEHPVVITGLLESLARALLTGHPHDHAHLLDGDAPASSPTQVRMAEEYLDAQAGGAVSIADLAALTGTGVLSLEAGFRRDRGTTPAAFLRARRLEWARAALLADPRAPLAAVAQTAGFVRPETFEAAYFKAFGESSAETRRKGAIALSAPPPAEVPPALAVRFASLTAREREVCLGAVRGMLNKQIAAELGISERTVKVHRARAMAKLGARSAAELGRLFR